MDMYNRYPNSEDYFNNIYLEHFIQSFHALQFCTSLQQVNQEVLESKMVDLPKKGNKQKTIVFDLDETLIHCNENQDVQSDITIQIKFPNQEVIEAGVNIRPFCREVLKELSKSFEIIVFTASHSCYADKVLDYLDPNNDIIDYRLFRESCIQTAEGVHIKDLRIFKNRDLKDIVLVDNAAYSFGYQIENGIPIIPYYDNKSDIELKYLLDFLKRLVGVEDVRSIIYQNFRMHLYAECQNIKEALEKVYGIVLENQLEQMQNNNDNQQQEEMNNQIYNQNELIMSEL
ncbi:NLI interacting factor-like phosphatase family protein, putative [Ichthyophthirius multifiliis]|uniref:NLI interacting factor-like phosphatase family protein, putative n=1 Tax=Ichthyophthirius multifiliis TaxID=5932 RepID=G0QM67_ICHMU|nr:NLI interacting factor-like phosphatase family protein, putative [Ichthyophthirius multifiliis]EGR33687.1 NLI interacting factor-like phosphatase family protein, putative [Ichthyophthirius multifiliis]|eukprot:XP_004037673.1 NLI interacting factor-like phosphatase family protein, putative [Ichthyophthirius multifiliis]